MNAYKGSGCIVPFFLKLGIG